MVVEGSSAAGARERQRALVAIKSRWDPLVPMDRELLAAALAGSPRSARRCQAHVAVGTVPHPTEEVTVGRVVVGLCTSCLPLSPCGGARRGTVTAGVCSSQCSRGLGTRDLSQTQTTYGPCGTCAAPTATPCSWCTCAPGRGSKSSAGAGWRGSP